MKNRSPCYSDGIIDWIEEIICYQSKSRMWHPPHFKVLIKAHQGLIKLKEVKSMHAFPQTYFLKIKEILNFQFQHFLNQVRHMPSFSTKYSAYILISLAPLSKLGHKISKTLPSCMHTLYNLWTKQKPTLYYMFFSLPLDESLPLPPPFSSFLRLF